MNGKGRLTAVTTFHLRRRSSYAALMIFLIFALLVVRLAYLQLYKGEELRLRSETNSIRLRKITPARGLIMDTMGKVLVENKPSFNVIYVPNRHRSHGQIKGELQRIYRERSLDLPPGMSKLQEGPLFVPIRLETAISKEKLAVIETNSHLLPGVFVEVAPVRKYPLGEAMAHVIGYMGEISQDELAKDLAGEYSFGDYLGKFGLEKEIGRFLKGRDGAEQAEVNAVGEEVKVLGRREPLAGYNAVLNIDLSLQQAAWNALDGKAGALVAMDPRDGAILAMVSSPSFDPDLFSAGIPRETWRKLIANPLHPLENRAISGQYPPASTYKVVVAAAALEEGLVGPDTAFNCNGEYEMGNRTFRCWRREGHGRVNLHRGIVESCDVYFYNLGKLLGVDRIAGYAHHFGLGGKTGIDLPHEKKGRVPTKKWKSERSKEPWLPGETIPVSIGQGYNLATPLQLAQVYSALANGGALYRPRIVKRLLYADGRVYREYPPEVISKLPLSEKTMQIINSALWGVVNEANGTGSALRRPEKDVSGKTGTAQVVQLARKGETIKYKVTGRRLKDHAIFVCFAPSHRPEIVVAVLIEHAGGGGGAVAAPLARKIVDAYFNK